MKLTTINVSSLFYVLKAFAVLFIVSAHMPFTSDYASLGIFWTSLSQLGCPIFFIVSGYFFSRKPNDTKQFWLKKLKTVFTPWFVFATLTYFVAAFLLNSRNRSVFELIKYIVGYDSIFWFMSVLIVFFVIFKFFQNKIWTIYICLFLTVASLFLSALNLIPYTEYFTHYLNIFNWVGFFAFGILLKRKKLIEKLINPFCLVFSFIILTIGIVVVILRGTMFVPYIDIYFPPLSLFSFLFFTNVSHYLSNCNILVDLGKKSFFIYLTHIYIAGVINTRLPFIWFLLLVKPLIALAVCYLIAIVFRWILTKTHLLNFSVIFGLDR